jgi:hypothetical protein
MASQPSRMFNARPGKLFARRLFGRCPRAMQYTIMDWRFFKIKNCKSRKIRYAGSGKFFSSFF